MKIIKRSELVTVKRFCRVFSFGNPCGFSFECTEDGKLLDMPVAAYRNYLKASNGGFIGLVDEGIEDRSYSYYSPTVGKCVCGEEIELVEYTNFCECGRLYNQCGQQLSDPSTWGEETGEHPCDIFRL